jgi:formamidopyrimidine-DNA glycosylase
MSGRLLVEPAASRRQRHTHLVLDLDDGSSLRLVDPRRFGRAELVEDGDLERHPSLALLGPEPLSRAWSARHMAASMKGSQRAIKTVLLDQRVVAGVGNIYACEALHRAAIAPTRPARQVGSDEVGALVRATKAVLRRAIRACGTTLKDFRDGWGVSGEYGSMLDVYGLEGHPCPRCGYEIVRTVLAQRSTFWCERCQR